MKDSINSENPNRGLLARLTNKVFARKDIRPNSQDGPNYLAQLGDVNRGGENTTGQLSEAQQIDLDTKKKFLEGINPALPEIYQSLMLSFPEIVKVTISLRRSDGDLRLTNTGGFWLRPGSKGENPQIVIATNNEHYLNLLDKRPRSAEKAAIDLGITLADIKNNPNILKLFIFLHELGHANEYLTKFANNPQSIDPVAASRSVVISELAKLPVPHKNPTVVRQMLDSGELKQVLASFHQEGRFVQIHTPEELFRAQEDAYRNMPTEKYADTFAVNALKPFLSRILTS